MKHFSYAIALYACSASALFIRDHIPRQDPCEPVSGTFLISQRNLFPESADWDPVHCKLYAGALYDASAIQYDPYTDEIVEIKFPNITGDTLYHVAGVDYDANSGSVFFAANAEAAWNFSALGQDLSGPNKLIKYNTTSDTIEWYADLSKFQAEIMAESGHLVAGFQDMAEDTRGNSYMIASFGDAIAKVSSDGQNVSVFYNAAVQNTSTLGLSALFTLRDDTLVVADSLGFNFLVFNTSSLPSGGRGAPRIVQPNGWSTNLSRTWCDGLVAPSRYNGSVALCTINDFNAVGGVAVFESTDGWHSADYRGSIERNNSFTVNTTPTATVVIDDSIFIVEEFFVSSTLELMTQPKDSFPFIDITNAVEDILYR